MTEHILITQEILLDLLQRKQYPRLRDTLCEMNPVDIAAVFADMDPQRLPLLFRLLPKGLAAETFVEMDPEAQKLLITGFSDRELKEVLDELFLDDAVDIVEEMPANVVQRILRQAEPDMRQQINEMLRYPENSVGSIMTTEYVDLHPDMTVEEAIRRIRRTGVDKETIYTCYVIRDRRLLGLITVKDLLLCPDDDEKLQNIMDDNLICVTTLDDREEAAQLLGKYDLMALPVVDQEHRLVGIVTFDDAMDVMESEATEDMEIMAAMSPSEKPYMKSTVFEIWKHRICWLLLLMVSATFTGMILNHFEHALAAQIALTTFIPMLMDTAGNSGSQTSVTIIRGLSLGEISLRDLPKVLWKEFRVAICCGVTLAGAVFLKMLLVDRWMMGGEGITFGVMFTVCVTMAATILIAKLVGGTLPVLAEKMGFDPAVMASPFITTIVDALSLLVYFGVASMILPL